MSVTKAARTRVQRLLNSGEARRPLSRLTSPMSALHCEG
jgi:hypothetical protein